MFHDHPKQHNQLETKHWLREFVWGILIQADMQGIRSPLRFFFF